MGSLLSVSTGPPRSTPSLMYRSLSFFHFFKFDFIEFYCFVNVKSLSISEFLVEPDIGADFWNIPELPDERVVRTRIVRIILERMENGDEICLRGHLFSPLRGCVFKRIIFLRRIDGFHTATEEESDKNKTPEERLESFHCVYLTMFVLLGYSVAFFSKKISRVSLVLGSGHR